MIKNILKHNKCEEIIRILYIFVSGSKIKYNIYAKIHYVSKENKL